MYLGWNIDELKVFPNSKYMFFKKHLQFPPAAPVNSDGRLTAVGFFLLLRNTDQNVMPSSCMVFVN